MRSKRPELLTFRNNPSDLDTFICLKTDNVDVRQEYLKKLAELHHQCYLKV